VNIYQRLKTDHDKQRSLTAEILHAARRLEERRCLFEALCDEIEAHAAAEEQTFYAELLVLSQDQALAQRSVAEHDAVAELLDALSKLEMPSPEWLRAFENLKDRIDRHLDQEESVTFALARSLISQDRELKLGDSFEKLKCREIATWGKAPPVKRFILDHESIAEVGLSAHTAYALSPAKLYRA
jgi:hemerythrin-like domain-containing protein